MSERSRAGARSRAEVAADVIGSAARQAEPGARLGSREDLRALCNVSVGTLHEALRLLQSTGEITVRTGPGGGVFAGERSALAGLLRDIRHEARTGSDFTQTSRVLAALAPLIIHDATAALDADGERQLERTLSTLGQAADGDDLQAFIRASLDVFATILTIPPASLLHVVAGSIIRAQIELLPRITGAIEGTWGPLVQQHLDAVAGMVQAIEAGDKERAIAARTTPGFDALFHHIHALPAS